MYYTGDVNLGDHFRFLKMSDIDYSATKRTANERHFIFQIKRHLPVIHTARKIHVR